MVTLKDFIHRLRGQNHLNVSITDSGSERVKGDTLFCEGKIKMEVRNILPTLCNSSELLYS